MLSFKASQSSFVIIFLMKIVDMIFFMYALNQYLILCLVIKVVVNTILIIWPFDVEHVQFSWNIDDD